MGEKKIEEHVADEVMKAQDQRIKDLVAERDRLKVKVKRLSERIAEEGTRRVHAELQLGELKKAVCDVIKVTTTIPSTSVPGPLALQMEALGAAFVRVTKEPGTAACDFCGISHSAKDCTE